MALLALAKNLQSYKELLYYDMIGQACRRPTDIFVSKRSICDDIHVLQELAANDSLHFVQDYL